MLITAIKLGDRNCKKTVSARVEAYSVNDKFILLNINEIIKLFEFAFHTQHKHNDTFVIIERKMPIVLGKDSVDKKCVF